MKEILLLALKMAMAIWGVVGTNVDIEYDPLYPYDPGTVGGLAYGDLNNCNIRIYNGYEFYEYHPPYYENIKGLVDIITHELGHCYGYRGYHSQDQCSIMFWFYGACFGNQTLTADDRMILFNYRNQLMNNKMVIGGISHD